MLEVSLLQNRELMHHEMARRFAEDEYVGFVNSYESLANSSSLDAQRLTDLARRVTLEDLDRGIRQEDPVLTLVDKYLRLPNIAAPEVPTGENGKGDIVVFTSDYSPAKFSKKPRTYIDLGTRLKIFDPESFLYLSSTRVKQKCLHASRFRIRTSNHQFYPFRHPLKCPLRKPLFCPWQKIDPLAWILQDGV